MKRRTFIAGLGSAAAWPVAAWAQPERMRHIGVLMQGDENDPLYTSRVSAFTQALASLGWTNGRNVRMDLRWDGADINRIRALAQELVGLQPDIIVMPDTFLYARRAPIISLAVRNNVPSVFSPSVWVREGGLLSYGPDRPDLFHRAASYVDRILRGAKPAELPVQLPTKFEMAVNLKTAKALGLAIPPSILLRADEVIE